MYTDVLKEIILVVKKYGKKIALYSIIAGILVGIISFFMPNYYKATSVFYPGNILLASPNPVGYGERERYPFGNGNDLDRLFAVSQSNELILHLIEKFDLASHFKMKNTNFEQKHKIVERFRSHYQISKNKYDAVELSFEDKDREMAAKIVNEARDFIAFKVENMVRLSTSNMIKSYEGALLQQENVATQIADSIKQLKNKFNITHSISQGSELSELSVNVENELYGSRAKVAFYKNMPKYIDSLVKYQAFVKAYEAQYQNLVRQSTSFNTISNEIFKLEIEFDKIANQIAIDKERLKGLKSMTESQFSAIHTVDVTQVPLYKSRPARLLYILSAMIMVSIFLLVAMVVINAQWFKELGRINRTV